MPNLAMTKRVAGTEGDVKYVTANTTLTVADSGKTIVASTADLVITLPPTKHNVRFTLVTGAVADGSGLTVSPNASDKFMGKGITAADDKDYINDGATDAVGDLIQIVGDGVDGWWVVGERGTWARET